MRRTGRGQDCDAERDAEGRAQDHGPDASPIERAPLHPDRVALHQEPECQDHGCGLHRAQDVKPDSRGHQAEGETGQPNHRGGHKGGNEEKAGKQRWIKTPDHEFLPRLTRPQSGRAALGWGPSDGEAAVSPWNYDKGLRTGNHPTFPRAWPPSPTPDSSSLLTTARRGFTMLLARCS